MSSNPQDQTDPSERSAFLSRAEITDWEGDKSFSTDWASPHFFMWAELLQAWRGKPVRVLEIGSWEGRSALFFLNFLPNSRIVCVDPFGGSAEHQLDPYYAENAAKSEGRFDRNLAGFRDRVEKIKGSSAKILPELGISGRRFDVAYIDGSHMAADVYADAVLAWSLVEPGGILIFDDYEWGEMDAEHERPKLGIDAFLRTIEGRYRELHRGWQIAIAKA